MNTLTHSCIHTYAQSHLHSYTYIHTSGYAHLHTHTSPPLSNPSLKHLWPCTLLYSGPLGALSSLGIAPSALEFQYHSLQCTLLGVQFKIWPVLREKWNSLYRFQKKTWGKKGVKTEEEKEKYTTLIKKLQITKAMLRVLIHSGCYNRSIID